MLLAAARAWALIAGRPMVLPEDVQAVFPVGRRPSPGRRHARRRGAGAGAAARRAAAVTPCPIGSTRHRVAIASTPRRCAAAAWLARAPAARFRADARRPRAGRAAPLAHLHPADAPRPGVDRDAGDDAADVAQLRAVAGLRRHVPARRAGGRRAAARVSQPRGHRDRVRSRRARRSPAARSPFTLAARRRRTARARDISLVAPSATRVAVDIAADQALTVTLDVAGAAARPPAARAASRCRPAFRSGCGVAGPTSIFRSTGIVYPGARSRRAAAAARPCRRRSARAGARRRRRSRRTARIPARRSAAARRLESRRPRRRLVSPSSSKARAAAARSSSSWYALPPGLGIERRLSRLTAWVLAAERAARPFALQLPGFALPPGQGRDHRRAALTALALFPRIRPSDEQRVRRRRRTARDRRSATDRRTGVLARGAGALARRAAVAAQLPHVAHLPIWVAAARPRAGRRCASLAAPPRPLRPRGTRRRGSRRGRSCCSRWPRRRRSAMSFGYFLGRDPCVAFLFILVGIKFLEARTPRDGTLLVCLASFLFDHAVLLQPVAARRACALPGRAAVRRDARRPRPARPRGPRPVAVAGSRCAAPRRLLLQGMPLAAMLFFLFPRLAAPLWGAADRRSAHAPACPTRWRPGTISELSLSDAVAFRVDFDGAVPPPALRYWRGPVLSRFDGREWTRRAAAARRTR